MGRELRREYGGFAAGWTGPIEALSSKATSERRAMSGKIEARLKELGIELPQPTAPLANYVPFTVSGNLVFIAGQISQWNGERRFVGKLGAAISIACAAVCGSAGSSTARPISPTCRRLSMARPI